MRRFIGVTVLALVLVVGGLTACNKSEPAPAPSVDLSSVAEKANRFEAHRHPDSPAATPAASPVYPERNANYGNG